MDKDPNLKGDQPEKNPNTEPSTVNLSLGTWLDIREDLNRKLMSAETPTEDLPFLRNRAHWLGVQLQQVIAGEAVNLAPVDLTDDEASDFVSPAMTREELREVLLTMQEARRHDPTAEPDDLARIQRDIERLDPPPESPAAPQ